MSKANLENRRYFTTTNRKLENFMYLHRINHVGQFKNDDGMNAWVYIVTPRFREILEEFYSIHMPDTPLTPISVDLI